jgi:deoxycytidylate deaminase
MKKPELVFALAGPVGTDLHLLAQALEESLAAYGYDCPKIRVSSLIHQWCDDDLKKKIDAAKGDERISLLMAAGDALRKQAKKGDGLVPLIAGAIRKIREGILVSRGVDDTNVPASNICFIIDSLKHPDEVESLRGIYGDNFILISAFSSLKDRKAKLCSIIAKSHLSTKDESYDIVAQALIDIDAKRPGERIGQSLRDTFPLADFFIRASGDFRSNLTRFLDLYFSSPYITPKRDEFFMFEAKAKAYRSADLSRQIGAVIVDSEHHIVSSGCNEVPIAGGGSFWPDMREGLDNRDYKKERDFNAVKKVEIIEELLKYLSDHNVMSLAESNNVEETVRDLLFGERRHSFKDLRVSNLIEFGRVVHAEMNAITDAARRGIKLGGGSIFSTTFPCHMCARHIISSGIMRVVYIEPYPKSMTEELFPEIVAVDQDVRQPDDTGDGKVWTGSVAFEPFEGVAPRLYPDLFTASPRKDQQGYTLNWAKGPSQPKVARTSTAHLSLELAVAKAVEQLADVSLEVVTTAAQGKIYAGYERRNSRTNSA